MEQVFYEIGVCEIEHLLTFSEEDDVLDKINAFVDFVHSDCLVITRKHSGPFEAIFTVTIQL